ncbi:uncharacterized protein LOC8057722 isoform X2 [Sorghum bicolor]|nr:uncharacterized protein LOC8057722 isoform X2 [Sorghum bicolor]|eukprot:XP_021311707.1 uncharacterized protein LOC8057722 isoform X2 [Sorghum bicolor]
MAAEMEQPLRESMSVDIEEEPRTGNGSIVENPPSDLVKSESDRIKTFYQTVLSAIMVFVTVALSSYKDMKPLYSTTSHSKARLSSLLVDEGLFIFMTFLCAVVLMMSEFFVYQYSRRGRAWCWVLTILVAVTGVMLIVADTILLIVANRSNMLLSVLLGPVVLLVGVAVSTGAWMLEEPSSDSELGKSNNHQVKRDPPLDLAACYATSTLSLIAMMVCAMPLALLPDDMLKVLVGVVERLRSAVLAALAVMALVVSVEFLDGFVVLSFFPEAVTIVLCFAVKLFSACQTREQSSPLDFTFTFRIVAAAGFTLMTGLYAAFMGTDHYGLYLRTAMFILLLAVLSSLSRLAIPLQPRVGGGIIEFGTTGVALAFPLLALLAAIPLVLLVFVDHYVNR